MKCLAGKFVSNDRVIVSFVIEIRMDSKVSYKYPFNSLECLYAFWTGKEREQVEPAPGNCTQECVKRVMHLSAIWWQENC